MPEHFLVQKIPAAPASASGSGDFSLVSRDDGSMQWALKGKPLYLYAAD
jgi:predicted lipoprotein with Yx(FWY)xxD motif